MRCVKYATVCSDEDHYNYNQNSFQCKKYMREATNKDETVTRYGIMACGDKHRNGNTMHETDQQVQQFYAIMMSMKGRNAYVIADTSQWQHVIAQAHHHRLAFLHAA